MSTISDKQTLRLQIEKYIDRTDINADAMDQIIDNGRRVAAASHAREQEQIVLLTLDADLRAPLPVRFMEARSVYTVEGINLPQIGSVFASVGEEGGYRVRVDKLEVFGGAALEPGDQVELHYFEYPPELVADTDSNPFLLGNADLWLWAACMEAARYVRNPELLSTAQEALASIGGRIESLANKGRQYGGPRRMQIGE